MQYPPKGTGGHVSAAGNGLGAGVRGGLQAGAQSIYPNVRPWRY